MPKRQYNRGIFAFVCIANLTNSSINDTVVTSCRGMTNLLLDNHHAAQKPYHCPRTFVNYLYSLGLAQALI